MWVLLVHLGVKDPNMLMSYLGGGGEGSPRCLTYNLYVMIFFTVQEYLPGFLVLPSSNSAFSKTWFWYALKEDFSLPKAFRFPNWIDLG